MVFAILAMVSAPALAGSSVQDGIRAWSAGNAERAVVIWRPLAAAGDADAQFNLGQAYKLGRGVPVSLASAQNWYERAARQSHRDAQTSLGLMLFGNGDKTAAVRWLSLAANAGEPRAMLVYGTALFNGDGVPVDRVRAYAFVSRAAAYGLAPAKATLADLDGALPLKDRKQGVALALRMTDAPSSAATTTPKTPRRAPVKPLSSPTQTLSAESGDSWRIQLGAFGQRSAAEALFRRLSASGTLAGKQPSYVSAGSLIRLHAGPYPTRAAAAAACAVLRGQACFPVR